MKDQNKEEYLAILAIFKRFVQNFHDEKSRKELMIAMMELRAEFSINRAIKGFGMDFETALDLVRKKKKGLSRLEREQKDALVAAIDNLIDFAVAEEFQMLDDLPDDLDIEDPLDLEECEKLCEQYNLIYAGVENGDITHAMMMAAWFIAHTDGTVLTYMTQGDERVRPWHRALEGTSYPKKLFPAWLIPPIEHGCRCYLVEESAYTAREQFEVVAKKDEIPDFVNPVFLESPAKGGRIFGPAHSYFEIPKNKKKKLKGIAKTIKDKWLTQSHPNS